MRKFFLLAVFALLFAASAGSVEACTCGGTPSVCMSYLAADAVFTGTVQRVGLPAPRRDADGTEYVAGQVAYIRVEKAFKGMKESEVIFRTAGTSCDAVYKEGQHWLFYAYFDRKSRRWATHACDRSTRLEYAADDLLYLQGLPASARKTRIAGELVQYEEGPAGDFRRVKNIAGAKIKLKGEGQTYEAYTDEDGAYEIYGLPPGEYAVEPEPLPGLRLGTMLRYGEADSAGEGVPKLVLRENGCAGASFVYIKAVPD
ncbi:MAG TPA: carboxypeptidase-like regulatory domain-containing protein [Pyrinomonadaceae bacterium]|jgi:hypothetical protein